MISWMQKHNKYLIITIWIATIAFVGAGFVGWGSYSSNSNSSYFGKVGSQELYIKEFRFLYGKIYRQYNDIFKGKFDQEQAKKFKLQEQIISSMIMNSYILNIAEDFNIQVSDKEIGYELFKDKTFYKKNIFNEETYFKYLKNNNLTASDFERIIKNNLIITKMEKLLNQDFIKEDKEILFLKNRLSDDIKYTILRNKDLEKFKINEKDFKNYWEANKNRFVIEDNYKFNVLWIEKDNKSQITDVEINEFFKMNGFKYKTDKGLIPNIEDVKDLVISDIKLINSKKNANLSYIKFKKGQIKTDEIIEYFLDSPNISGDIAKQIEKMKIGDILKPKIINKKYAILKLIDIKKSRIKTFKESRNLLVDEFKIKEERNKLLDSANKKLKDKNYIFSKKLLDIRFSNIDKLDIDLDLTEKDRFIDKLFVSKKSKGFLIINDKTIIIYKILNQKLLNDNKDFKLGNPNDISLKSSLFSSNLIKILEKQYKSTFF